MKILIPAAVGVASLLTIAMMTGAGWDHPPVEAVQRGYRGLGQEHVYNPRVVGPQVAAVNVPPPAYEIDPSYESPNAASVYSSIQVLTDITEDQMLRLMDSMARWVSPQQSCAYCHNEENLADDSMYTHKVSRRMLQMTRELNGSWTDHVSPSGVTCYTCHRGQPIPEEIWFNERAPRQAGGFGRGVRDQNMASATVGYTSLPSNAFELLTGEPDSLRVITETALPSGNTRDIVDTEATYGLMFHLSGALGVNCTYCHNTRSFFSWDQSPPQRTTAWHGIQMVRHVNNEYLEPLQSVLPPARLGALGDAPKANCATCHQGAYKPLFGTNVIDDYPSLRGPSSGSGDGSQQEANASNIVTQ